MRIRLASFLLILLSSIATAQQNLDYKITYEDRFSQDEKIKINSWLDLTSKGVYRLFGKYPFRVNYYIHRNDNQREPVPWAHTVRDGEEGVHFHINPDFSLEDFLADWTAPHEISHLAIPYVGRENMWFSEGFASYFQYLVMAEMQVITTAEAERRIKERIKRIQTEYDSKDSFLERYSDLLSRHDYPAVYWGGASFFLQVDRTLHIKRASSLATIIGQYLIEHRLDNGDLNQLIDRLDWQSHSALFTVTMNVFNNGSAYDAVGGIKIQ